MNRKKREKGARGAPGWVRKSTNASNCRVETRPGGESSHRKEDKRRLESTKHTSYQLGHEDTVKGAGTGNSGLEERSTVIESCLY